MQEFGNAMRVNDNTGVEAEREEEYSRKNPTKIYLFILAIAVLVATNVYFYLKYKNTTEISYQISTEKMQLRDEVERIEAEVNRLSTENMDLSEALILARDSVRVLIADLKERLSGQEISRAELQEAQREVSQLRSSVYAYRSDLEQLKTQHDQLLAAQADLQREYDEKQRELRLLAERNMVLSDQVKQASVLKTSHLEVNGIREKSRNREDLSHRARRVDKLRLTFSIVDNPLIEPGELPIYIRVIDPTGNLNTSQDQFFQLDGNTMQYTAKTVINFTNRGESYTIDWLDPDGFKKGIYTVLLYTENTTMGRTSIVLD